ncbi:MAG: N-acetylmuramoyl-L-alanine amidase, partial [Thermomicrobiaceae bacterium]
MLNLLKERINRRQVMKVAGGLLLASVFDLHRTPTSRAEMTRMRWIERNVFPSSGTYQSAAFTAAQQFESVEIGWNAEIPDGSRLDLRVRTSVDGEQWTDWHHMHLDTHIDQATTPRVYAMPHISGPSNHVQYELQLIPSMSGATPSVHEVEIGCVDTSPPAQFMSTVENEIDGWIISRAGWGANEDLRYSDGSERWTPRYAPIQKVIVHHTVTSTGGSDPAAVVRSIYYYHAVTLGWGDIGYNYLVDQSGNVYEGRYGGPEVIGAHTLSNNTGSLGIAAIGNFENSDTSQAAIASMARIVGERAPHLDPMGAGAFGNHTSVPNVCAHRDFMATECPGNGIYSRLPEIRSQAGNYSPPPSGPGQTPPPVAPATAEITNVTMIPDVLYAGGTLRVDITVKNTGSNTVQTQSPPPLYVYEENEDFTMAFGNRIEGRFRVGIDFEGNTGLPNPWRWGLPGPLAPGESTTVTGFVRLQSAGQWNLSACLVNELVRYEQIGVFPHTVTAEPPPTNPAGQDSDPSMHFFDVTSHNVPDVFYTYWENNGG